MLGKVNRANLSTFAALGMLAYLDLSQWERDSGAPIIDTQYAELLNIDLDRLRETKSKAALVRNDFVLRGWLLQAAREAIRKSAPRVLREI